MTDDIDDALRTAIGARSGGPVPTESARHAVVARARRVRTLRTVAVGSATTLVVVIGLVALARTDSDPSPPADRLPPPTITAVTSPPATTVATPTTREAGVADLPATSSSTTMTTSSSTRPTTTSTAESGSDAPFTRRFESSGGSITVEWDGSSLALLSVAARDGFETEIEDRTASRIRVRFRGDDDARIEVRVRDGRVEHTVS